MAARWDGKIGKIPKIGDKRETKRFSPKVQQGEPEFHECRTIDEEREEDKLRGNPREPGAAQLYTPETVSQYKSQWARYQRALSLTPAGITQQGKDWIYKFASCDSLTGFWEVTVSQGATFLKIKKPIWQILCPKQIEFDVIDSDGETFTWTQTRGRRTATLNDVVLSLSPSLPMDSSIPTLNIFTLCLNSGCADDSPHPIVLNVQPEGQPELLESVIIYTTPTSFYDGFCYSQHDSPVEKSIIKPSVASTQKAYLNINPNILGIDWFKPEQNSEHVVGYAVQENINGIFTTVQAYTLTDNPKHLGKFDTSYRVITYFDNNEFRYATTSNAFRFDSPKQITNEIGDVSENKVLFGDDNYGSKLSYNFYYNFHESVALNVQFINPNNDVYDSKLSYGFYYNSHESLPLNVQFINPNNDEYSSKLSYSLYYNSHESLNLGGIIIA